MTRRSRPTPPTSLDTTLLDELKQSRPFDSQTQAALLGVARTASVIERTTAKLLAPFGLSTAQYNVLRILRGAGTTGLPTLSIRERLIDPAAAITRLVDKLDRAGLLTRERDPADRRQVTCWISPAGLDLLARIDPLLAEVYRAIDETAFAAELPAFNRALDQLRRLVRAGGGG
jgi:DNA-binding MarR family transcriptional regulator